MIAAAGIIAAAVVGIAVTAMAGLSYNKREQHLIEDVKTGKDGVALTMKGNTLHISYEVDDGEFFIDLNDSSKPVGHELSGDGQVYVVTDERFQGVEISPVLVGDETDQDAGDLLCMKVRADNRDLIFRDSGDDRGYLYYNSAGKFSDFRHYERSSIFPDKFLTDRGLLWNNCISLIPKSIIKGSGAGTFVYVYPNDDDLVRLYDDSGVNYYDVKAHSLYFQQIIENGLLSLIFFLIFIGSVRRTVPLTTFPFARAVRTGILFGTLCYLICGLTVDSNVTTAPVFWILTGIAAGI